MSRANAERLKLAIQDAKKALGDDVPVTDSGSVKSKSKINKILGITKIPDLKRTSILSNRVTQKTEFDLISDAVLGKDTKKYQPIVKIQHESDNFSEKFSRRIEKMRERAFSPLSKVTVEKHQRSEIVGRESNGVEVWRSFVHHDFMHAEEEISTPTKGRFSEDLSKKRVEVKGVDNSSNFRNWIVYQENERATAMAEAVVRSPNKMNPVLFWGPIGVGKSHIMNCVANGFISHQEGNVRIFSKMEIENGDVDILENIDVISEYSVLGFDGIGVNAGSEQIQARLGNVIDLALNLGIQIIATSSFHYDEWSKSRVWEIFSAGTTVSLSSLSLTSKIQIIRKMASKDGLLLDNSQVMMLAELCENWRDLISKYNQISVAIEDGISVISSEDVKNVIEGKLPGIETAIDTNNEPVEKIATSMIDSALDVVFDNEAVGGIELQTELPELEDDWEPSDLELDKMIKDDRILAEKYIKVGLDQMIPAPPNVLSVHERDQYLVKREEELESGDVERVVDTIVDIDINLEEKILAAEKQLSEDFAVIAELESKISELSKISDNASVEELIELADSIKQMEDKIMGQEIQVEKPKIKELNNDSSEYSEDLDSQNSPSPKKQKAKPRRRKKKDKAN